MISAFKDKLKGCSQAAKNWQDGAVSSLMRIFSEGGEDYLQEMLMLLVPVYGNGSTLSIVSLVERDVLVSTDAETEAVSHMARSVTELQKKGYYLRNEKNGIKFRSGFHCIRIVPLVHRKQTSHALIVEQKDNVAVVADRCMEVLAVAVWTHTLAKQVEDSVFRDAVTGLAGREALLRDYPALKKGDVVCLGLLVLQRDALLLNGVDSVRLQGHMCVIAKLLSETFQKHVYCVGENRFAILLKGRVYDCVSALQDMVDVCAEDKALPIRGVVSLLDDGVDRALYLAERAVLKATDGLVMLVRDRDVDVCAYEEAFFCTTSQKSDDEKEEEAMDDIVFEEVSNASDCAEDVNVDTREKEMQESIEEAEKSLSFFFELDADAELLDDI